MKSREYWPKELDFLASAPAGEAHHRWLELMVALGLAPIQFNHCAPPGFTQNPTSIAQEKAGYLDVTAVVRERKWENKDNPLAYIADAAKRLHRKGELGPLGGIVTRKGAHDGGFRSAYGEDKPPIGAENTKVSLQMALAERVENAPLYVRPAARFPAEYTITYELSPTDHPRDEDNWYGDDEDCSGPLEPQIGVDFEKIAKEEGFDEFSVNVLMYRVHGVGRIRALELEKERYGRFSSNALGNAWKHVDRIGGWESYKRAVKSRALPRMDFADCKTKARYQRNGNGALLSLDQVAKKLNLTLPEADDYVRSRKLKPADGRVPKLFHPHECDRFEKKHRSPKSIDDSGSNLAARTRNGFRAPGWEWSAWVTSPAKTTRGKIPRKK